MRTNDFNEIFANNLNFYIKQKDISQAELAKAIGVTPTSVGNWCNGLKTPRMDKVDKMCAYFHINRSDLLNERTEHTEQDYYLNPEVTEMAQEMYDRPEMRVLFDASRKATKEDIEQVAAILEKLGNK